MKHTNTLKPTREAAGKTQQGTAFEAGIALSYYQRLEAGDSAPTIPVARALADALGTTVDALWPMLPAAVGE